MQRFRSNLLTRIGLLKTVACGFRKKQFEAVRDRGQKKKKFNNLVFVIGLVCLVIKTDQIWWIFLELKFQIWSKEVYYINSMFHQLIQISIKKN